jgi:hypothetical protein
LPDDPIGCFFRYLLQRNAHGLSAALGELVRYTLTASDLNHVIARITDFPHWSVSDPALTRC